MSLFKKTIKIISLLGLLIIPSVSSAVTFYKPFMESSRGEIMKASVPIELDNRLNESMDSVDIEVASKASYELANIPYNADVSDIKFNLTVGQNGFPYALATSKSVMTSDAYRVLVRIHNKITGTVVYQDFNLGSFPSIKKSHDVMSTPYNAFNKLEGVSQVRKSMPRFRIKRETVKPVVIAIRKRDVRVNPIRPVLSKMVPSSSYNNRPSTYKVKRGDILTGIAKKLSRGSSDWDMWSMTGALYEENKDSFTKGNINLLKIKSILKLPSNPMLAKYKKYTRAYSMAKISNDADLLKVVVVEKENNNYSLDSVGHVSKQARPMPTTEFQKKALSSIEEVLIQAKKRSNDIDSLHSIIKKQIDKIDDLENRAKNLQSAIDSMILNRAVSSDKYKDDLSISDPQVQISILVAVNILLTIIVLGLLIKRNKNSSPPEGYNPSGGFNRPPSSVSEKETKTTEVKKDIYDDLGTIDLKDDEYLLEDDFSERNNGEDDIVRLPVNLDRSLSIEDGLSLNKEILPSESDPKKEEKGEKVEEKSFIINKLSIPSFFKTGEEPLLSGSKNTEKMSNDEAEEKIKKASSIIMNKGDLNEDDFNSARIIIKDLLLWSPNAFRVMSLKIEMYSKRSMKKEMLKYMSNVRLDLSDNKWDIFLSMLSKDIVDDYNAESI